MSKYKNDAAIIVTQKDLLFYVSASNHLIYSISLLEWESSSSNTPQLTLLTEYLNLEFLSDIHAFTVEDKNSAGSYTARACPSAAWNY